MLKEIWNHLLKQVQAEPEVEHVDKTAGKLSIEEVRVIAQQVADQEDWCLVEPREIELWRDVKTNKLFWSVTFLLKGIEEWYATGTTAFVDIEDETSKIVKKGYIPY